MDPYDATGDEDDPEGDRPPPKRPWYERVGNVLKALTYHISVGLEFLKVKIPILRPIPFAAIDSKVRNVIDNVVTTIKVFTGHITKEEAVEECMNMKPLLPEPILFAV